MTMTLIRLLEVNVKLILPEDSRALDLAEIVWRKRGCPTTQAELTDLLERVLKLCAREGIPYPKIILKRKKQLERGEWSPNAPQPATSRSTGGTTQTGCSQCGDTGYRLTPERRFYLCECGAWKKETFRRSQAGHIWPKGITGEKLVQDSLLEGRRTRRMRGIGSGRNQGEGALISNCSEGHMGQGEARLLTVEDVADLLRVPKSWVYGQTRKRSTDRIPGFRLGKYWRFREADVLAWLASRKGVAGPNA